ncbi:hypothetical protein EDC04DRAFT_2849349 [Pisolithus marmoratus]|nr:hypothetical protein EDC04DRAFT_2849349 [Pisolithus marmoratus]
MLLNADRFRYSQVARNMATYASVAAQNAPPPSDQPHPDPSLLTKETGDPEPALPDIQDKVTIYLPSDDAGADVPELIDESSQGGGEEKGAGAPDGPRESVTEGTHLWRQMKRFVFQPEVAGGLIGLSAPRWNRQVVASVSVGLIALWGAEGYIAEKYRERHRR